MKKKVIIAGINNYTDIFFDYLSHDEQYEVYAYTVDEQYMSHEVWNGRPVVAFEKLVEIYSPLEYCLLLGIGYSNMNEGRKRKFLQAKGLGYEILTYIHATAIVLTDDIGEGNLIMSGAIVEHGCHLGDANIINPNVLISHNTSLGDYNFIAGSSAIAGNVIIGNNCMLGLNCTVKNDIEIADYTLIGAGTYINKSTEKYGVYVPARALKLCGKDSREMKI